ncbi:MAG: hypothetical protein JWQ13_4366 [Ramlibacter sp.]|jgi:hypothetical protein|nr:hypothetical protein [Ramlibacter sp.]
MRFFSYLTTLLFVVLLAACGGGGGSPGQNGTAPPPALFTTAPPTLTLSVGSAQEFAVQGGAAPYTAVSNNSAIAVVGMSGGRITLGGVAPGTATITIRDAAGAINTVAVTVAVQPLFTTAPAAVTLGIGSAGAQTYKIGAGSGPYTATSSNVNVVTATVGTDNNLLLTGVAAGTATVTVRDNFGTTVNIPVTVDGGVKLPLFSSAPSAVTIAIGSSASYLIGGGTAPYMATSSNTNVATVTLSTGGNLTINGVAAGAANILIRDAAGATLTLAVTVGGGTLTVNPSSATALIGDVLVAKVTGGRAPYTAVVSNQSVADATIGADGVLRVTLKQQAASVPVLITDANGLSTSFTVTSSAGQPSIQISPMTLAISELSTEAVTLRVYGASGTISAFSSDTSLLQATASNDTVTVNTGSKGTRCVTADTPVTISVVDSTGALATSVITIRNSTVSGPGAACP